MSEELEKIIYAVIGGFIGFLFTSVVQWYTDKKERKRVKTAEYFSALSKYVDYLITITFYPKRHIENNYKQMLVQLEVFKSQFIESQCLLIAYNYNKYLNTKDIVWEAINIDGEFIELIFTQNYTDNQLRTLNDKAFEIIKKVQRFIENSEVH